MPATATKSPVETEAASKPLTKELDPDYVEPKAQQLVVYAKKCAPGCEQQGNCNAEEGRCECPYGYYGPTCEKEIFPACKLAPEATEMHCGERMPRSCECFRQCRKFYCKGGKGACETPRDPWFVRCFERVKPAGNSSTAAAVYSDVPEEWEEKQGLVAWHRGIRTDLARERLARQKATTVPPLLPGGSAMVALPVSQCPDKCTLRGQCIKSAASPTPRCLCWQGFTGDSCEQVYKHACINQCMGRGTCRGGFCHCQPGYWGKDCSRSRAYPPHNAHSSITALKIYVYELPTHLSFDMEQYVGFPGHDPTYIAYKGFMAGLLHDWTVRTENPWEANMFYVPALTYAYSSNLGDVVEHLRRVMSWVRSEHPFFNRTGGRDHFLWLPNDRGACWVDPRDPLLANVIKVVHFGFHQHNTKLPGDFQLMPQKGEACFEPERDIVAAPYSYKQEAIANETYSSFDPNAIPSERLLFFAGSIHTDEPDYSGGVRQELWKLYQANKLGDKVLVFDQNRLPDFEDLVRSSKFCLAPWGHGWGNRLGLYMIMGCVPVIIQDGVYQPYHDLLPYPQFSITLSKSRLPSIAQVLGSISDEEYIKLRQGMQQYWRAFVWHPLAGGQAYNYTIQSLHHRVQHHLGGLY